MDNNAEVPDVLQVRDLRAEYIGKEVSIKGIVHDLDMIKPKLLKAVFVCGYCETEIITDSLDDLDGCKEESCGRSDRLVFLKDKSLYTNYLQMTLAHILELGDSLKKYSILVDIEGDLVNGIKEKDIVVVKGILQTTADKQRKIPKDLEYTLTAASIEILGQPKDVIKDIANKASAEESVESKSKKDVIKIKEIIKYVGEKHPGGKAPLEEVYAEAKAQHQFDRERAEELVSTMRRSGDLLKPDKDHVKVI